MKRVRVGLIGSGFIATLHMHAYRRVFGLDVEVRVVCSLGDGVTDFARRFGIPDTKRDWRTLLTDPEIDVIDICTPPALHADMVVACMRAGKHVICEKPFTGYFGRPGRRGADRHACAEGADVPARDGGNGADLRRHPRQRPVVPATPRTGSTRPRSPRSAEILRATRRQDPVHEGRGSPQRLARRRTPRNWSMSGGGALIRQGCHPLAAILYLKQVEAAARGERITVADVTCDVGSLTAGPEREQQRRYIQAKPVDVEDWGMLSLTFSDATKATVFAGDMIMGGVRNLVETYTTGGSLFANIAPNNHVVTYLTDEAKLGDVYITEKVDRKTGWQFVCVDEEATRGYVGEIQDFMECVAFGRQPLAGVDLAYEAIKVHYAGYWAAEEGRRISL